MTVQSLVYDANAVETYEDPGEAKAASGTTWVRVSNASEAELREVADAFGIHSLAIEDVLTGSRPKTEEYPEYVFILVKTIELAGGETTFEDEIEEIPVGVFLGSDWVVSMATQTDAPIDRVWNAVERGDERLLHRGADFTAYRLLDVVVDEYFAVLDRIEDDIEAVEEEVTVSTNLETLEAINDVRRDLLSFRKLAWPTREALSALARGDPPQINEATEKYYRDVYDHLVHVVDLIETYRDLANGARDIYLNALSQSTNEVMKTLTVVATIFLPLTFVVGVYGMNFADGQLNMPELGWTYGYPAVWLGMLGVAIAMLWYFRRQEFL